MVDAVNTALKNIYRGLSYQHLPLSLMGGAFGVELFRIMYRKVFKIESTEIDDEQLQELFESSFDAKLAALSSGKAGFYWFFTYLYNQRLLSKKDLVLLSSDQQRIISGAIDDIRIENFDYLHGAIGIAQYLVTSAKKNRQFFKYLFDNLEVKVPSDGLLIYHFDFFVRKPDTAKINIGLSHGIIAVLKLCIDCYKNKIEFKRSKVIAYRLIDFLIRHVNKDRNICYFASILNQDDPGDGKSRLAWCYGDLTIGYVLYCASEAFRDKAIEILSLEVLIATTKRKTFDQTGVKDLGICHGASGIAHVYNRMWNLTGNPIFKEACDFWIKETLTLLLDGPNAGKRYIPKDEIFEDNYSLLEGTAGAGLVLLSYLTGDFSWDYCIMLN